MSVDVRTLGQLISFLKTVPLDAYVYCGGPLFESDFMTKGQFLMLDDADSYRGYYERLGLHVTSFDETPEPGYYATVAGWLEKLQEVLGSTCEGYKGGEYLMDEDVLLHVVDCKRNCGPAVKTAKLTEKGVKLCLESDTW